MLKEKEHNEIIYKIKNDNVILNSKFTKVDKLNKQLQNKLESLPDEITSKIKSDLKFQ